MSTKLSIIINTDFDKYDEEYLQSFTEFGDFTFLPKEYSGSFTNAFIVIDAYILGMSVFDNHKWVDKLCHVYSSTEYLHLFNVEIEIIFSAFKHIAVLGWNSWVNKVKKINYY
jgi:hypothetical protein